MRRHGVRNVKSRLVRLERCLARVELLKGDLARIAGWIVEDRG